MMQLKDFNLVGVNLKTKDSQALEREELLARWRQVNIIFITIMLVEETQLIMHSPSDQRDIILIKESFNKCLIILLK